MMRLTSSIFSSKGIKNIFSIVVVIVITICGLHVAEMLTCEKKAESRDLQYKTFFANPEQYDVFFMGTSHVMYGVSPLEIWNEYGITSFNWGSPSCTIPQSYWKLMNALDYHTPKLVVIDCYRAVWEYKSVNEYRMHDAFDAFPLSYTKIKTIEDLMFHEKAMNGDAEYSRGQCIDLLFPLRAYHSRWDSLDRLDFKNTYVDTKGTEFGINVAIPNEISDSCDKLDITENMVGFTYLERTIAECKKRNIEVLLTYLPYPTDENWKKEANTIAEIAIEYGVNYLDFTRENVVDYFTDCADPSSHLNVLGQDKVSKALGKYIVDNYSIPTPPKEVSEEWDELYTIFRDYKDNFILEEDELINYLMLLEDMKNDVVIDIVNPEILDDELIYRFLSNLYIDINDSTEYIIRVDGQVWGINREDSKSIFRSNCDKLEIIEDKNGEKIYWDNCEIYNCYKRDNSLNIQISKNLEVFDRIGYKYLTDDEGNMVTTEIVRE